MFKKKETDSSNLISLCIQGDESAWKTLFERYNTFIDRQIIKTFHLDYYPYTEEDFDQTKNNVIDLLLSTENLKKIDKPDSFKQWLARVSRNKTHDFVRQRKAVKSSAEEEATKSAISFQNPRGPYSGAALESMIGQEGGTAVRPVNDLAEKIKEIISTLDWIYRIPLKLYLIFCDDLLQPEDIERIAGERDVKPADIRHAISLMLDMLIEKQKKNICHEAEIRVFSSYLNRLKHRLDFLSRGNEDNQDEISKTEKAIEVRESRLSDLLAKKPKPVVPSNKEIGGILGLQEETVATRLFRGRKMIKERCA